MNLNALFHIVYKVAFNCISNFELNDVGFRIFFFYLRGKYFLLLLLRQDRFMSQLCRLFVFRFVSSLACYD